MNTDKIAIFLSILALIVSVFSPFFEYFWNYKINITNLEAEYFRSVYGEFLMKSIPVARENITFNGIEVLGTDKLLDTLRNIRIESLYFKCMHIDFYEKLLKIIQDVEDYIILNEKEVNTHGEYLFFESVVRKKINDIYKLISEHYIGKNRTFFYGIRRKFKWKHM